MNSITIKPSQSALETVDIDKAMQQGRRLRAEALTSFLKSLFGRKQAERDDRRQGFAPDCAAPA